MPKVTMTDMQKESDRLRANLRLMQGGRTNSEMARIFGASANTYARRLARPTELTYYEVYCLCRRFKVSVESFYTEELKIK